MSITSASPSSESVAVFRDHPDKAGIIIESPITNLTFSSNMDGIVNQRNEPGRGRYVLIIEPFTQIIVVDAPGYVQGRFRVGSPSPRDVLYYEIQKKGSDHELISVIFNVRPEDALLYVDDQQTETNRAVQLPPGSAEVRLEQEGYRTIQDAITINPNNIQFNYVLNEVDIVPVRFTANTPGARVLIDGVEQGSIDNTGNFGVFLYPGQYSLNIQMGGYLSQNRIIDVSDVDANRFDFQLERNIGELQLDLTPADAQVLINRQHYTGMDRIELPPGRYRIEIEKGGYEPFSETIEILRNQILSRRITLYAYTGSFQYTVTPGNAQTRLIDMSDHTVQEWEGLNLLRGLKVGSYRLIAEAPGYQSREQNILINKDETLQYHLELKEGLSFECGKTLTDIDGNEYRTVQIGNQCWMAENLRTSKYRDGTLIPNIRSKTDWNNLLTGAWVHYNNLAHYETTKGKLYNWHAIDDKRGLCPTGWNVPKDDEWTRLERYLGMSQSEINSIGMRKSGNIGGKLKSTGTQSWQSPNHGATNVSGFSALPGGLRVSNGSFYDVDSMGFWWTASELNQNTAYFRRLQYNSTNISRGLNNKQLGYSVRCIKD